MIYQVSRFVCPETSFTLDFERSPSTGCLFLFILFFACALNLVLKVSREFFSRPPSSIFNYCRRLGGFSHRALEVPHPSKSVLRPTPSFWLGPRYSVHPLIQNAVVCAETIFFLRQFLSFSFILPPFLRRLFFPLFYLFLPGADFDRFPAGRMVLPTPLLRSLF